MGCVAPGGLFFPEAVCSTLLFHLICKLINNGNCLFRDLFVQFVVELCGTSCFDGVRRPTARVLLFVGRGSRGCAIASYGLHLAGWLPRMY
jgi:hypothetical protein